MTGLARIGDRTDGTCFAHVPPLGTGGTIVTGSPDTLTNNLLQARLGDTVLADCGHKGTIVTSSSTVFCNHLGVARLGDRTTGDYVATIVTASSDSFAD